MIERVFNDPFIPDSWPANGSGMRASSDLSVEDAEKATAAWKAALGKAIESAQELVAIGVHKEITNRLLEPWGWIDTIATATEWSNFFSLRCHPDAQPEIQKLAYMMFEQYQTSIPVMTSEHLPFITTAEWNAYSLEDLRKLAVGRCARVSYLTHEGKRDPQADIALHDRLLNPAGEQQKPGEPRHMSAFEHIASAKHGWFGNFRGWESYRKRIPGENISWEDFQMRSGEITT